MTMYDVKWEVIEYVIGPGQHDDGRKDGDRRIIACGETTKEAISEANLRVDLLNDLGKAFPAHAEGPTYDVGRYYSIEIKETV